MPSSVRLRSRGGGVPLPPSFTSPATYIALAENNIDFTVTTNEACTYAITGGADQAQFELNGSVLTLVAQAYAPGSGNDKVVVVTATSTTTGLTKAQTITAVVTDIATAKLVPTSQWTGTAGTGYGGANPAAPVDPVRTGPKMVCRMLQQQQIAFADDYTLVVHASSDDGVESVTFYCEGQEVEVLAPKWWPKTKPDGTTLYVYGYGAQFDHSAIQAFGVSENAMNVYMKATPPTGSTIQERVIGPYLYYARDAGVGAGCVYDFEVYVDPLATDNPGVRYNTIVKALLYCSQQSKLRPHIVLERTGRYTTAGNISSNPHTGSMWWTIEAASGVTAQLGNFDISTGIGTSWNCDNLHFLGAGIVFELAAMAPQGGWMFRAQSGSTNSLWIDGCEVTGGDYAGSGYPGGTGAGQHVRYYGDDQTGYFFSRNNTNPFNFAFTHVNMHDIPSYGLDNSVLILDCDVARCSGSTIEGNYGAIQGLRVTEMGGVQSGERNFVEVFTLTYTGAAALAQINKLTQNGRNTISGSPTTYPITFWEDGAEVGSLATVDPGTSTYTTIQDLVDYINTLPDWTATATGSADDLAWGAEFIGIADMVPSAGVGIPADSGTPYSKRTVTSSPLSVCRIADVHANALVWDPSLAVENVCVEFVEGYDIIAAAALGMGTVKDFRVRWVTLQDTSAAYQIANPTQNPEAVAQVSVYSGVNSHLVIDGVVYEGPGQQALTKSTATFDAACRISNSVYEAFSVEGAGKPAFTGNVFRTGSLPSGSDATSKALGGAYTEDQLFADPFGAVPDFTPISSQLTLSTGKYAGGLVPTAKSTSYNRGWNLGSLQNSL